MNTDTDFDAYLSRQLAADELPDQGFSHEIEANILRHRRRRRLIAAGVIAVACAAAALILYQIPWPSFGETFVSPRNVVAALMLAAFCALTWIGTESEPPIRVPIA